MSVRAYKIIKVELADQPTFGFRDNYQVIDLAYRENMNEGGGQLTFDKETLEEVLTDKKSGMTEESNAIIKKMIADCGDNTEVEYECY